MKVKIIEYDLESYPGAYAFLFEAKTHYRGLYHDSDLRGFGMSREEALEDLSAQVEYSVSRDKEHRIEALRMSDPKSIEEIEL